ncbi:unnamed protein product [Cylindrotheca closterium]|uniref:Kinesin motor domain-containing protein n=1 Tax=Cylindrotheca closterium TaxID=2856 RepID=A0AAD2CJF8_9STRA|nr:unnamed protein product [Cylindrotheca closterium]
MTQLLSTTGGDEGSSSNESSVQVAVRVRPMLSQEAGNTNCVDVLSSNSIDLNVVQLGGGTGPKFTFDEVFPIAANQSAVYTDRVLPLVHSCMEGYNATILAYGQTGSGKTFTIMGPSSSLATSVQDETNAGVIPRAIRKIFTLLNEARDKHNTNDDFQEDKKLEHDDDYHGQPYQFEVRVQFLEVYGEDIRDLLVAQQGSRKLTIRDVGLDEPEVVGATEQVCCSPEEAILCLTRGMYRRVTGATAMNQSSSRSHAMFSLIVEQSIAMPDEDNSDNLNAQTQVQSIRSKFNFVDLAGSERQKRTQAEGLRLKEGIDINQGLLVLGNVISALGDPAKRGKAFVPYRDSKLTRLLKGSLGGNHKTLMIACVSPSRSNMEETLNCLRYANRAKNIQNHAVVNMDATSRLVAGLRSKMQMLASELLKAHDATEFESRIPIEVIESIADGGDGDGYESKKSSLVARNSGSRPKNDALEMELHQLKAENEGYKIQLSTGNFEENDKSDGSKSIQKAFVERSVEYEREIAQLKVELMQQQQASSRSRSHQRSLASRERSESPEMRRLRAQMLGSLSSPQNLDAEVEAEEQAAKEVMTKFLSESGDGMGMVEDGQDTESSEIHQLTENEAALRLEADLHELSTSIDAKEDLIQKLLTTQEKFEAMRQFYEGKLHEMETLLSKSEVETEKLSQELDRLEKGHSSEAELQTKLKEKQEQVAQLRKKQKELTRLTSVATRNESQIGLLRAEVTHMKQKKADLQKQISSERKSHAIEVQSLKKQSMQKERELNKVKRMSDKRAVEAEKAKNIAKTRLEHINQLKSKYKESEKRLRLQTLKRGVMNKAGFDSVMVGRRDSQRRVGRTGFDVDSLRDFFDDKVADVGRKEALAEKLAQEWEEHLELSIRKQELQVADEESEEIMTVDSKIKYKEGRIRQLAAKLGKRRIREDDNHEDDPFLFDNTFRQIVGHSSPTATKAAARVLFGMVVRERRRIATLARTASLLDERVQTAEAASTSKDEAFRAYINEQRLEAASQAQNQQEHILSLMEMVREEPAPSDDTKENSISSNDRSSGNSKLVLLANERISVLESQLDRLNTECDDLGQYRQKEEIARSELMKKSEENKKLAEEIKRLRSTLRKVRDDVTKGEEHKSIPQDEAVVKQHKIVDEISNALRSQPIDQKLHNSLQPGFVEKNGSFDLEYNSDDDDEVPDWAEDIMKDLAVIAEGKMPTSLLDSSEVVDAEAQLEQANVFDRLTNPSRFTGVQKQKRHTAKRPPKHAIKRDSDSEGSGARSRKPIKVTESISKLVVSSDTESVQSNRSVFDRLVSPSNATGTQKNRMQESQRSLRGCSDSVDEHGQGSVTSDITSSSRPPTRIEIVSQDSHRGIHTSISKAQSVQEQLREAETLLDSVLPKDFVTSNVSPKAKREKDLNYETQDVFERLTKTTTQAYALKQNISVVDKLLDSVLDDKKGPPGKPTHRRAASLSGKTDEHDMNQSAHKKRSSSLRKPSTEYKSVFERLHKTPTEAAANRKSHSTRTLTSL